MAEQGNSLTGILKVEIPNPALSVVLTFETSGDGDEWTAERLAETIRERGVSVPTVDTLNGFLRKASAANGTYQDTVIEGTPPETPSPETVSWNTDLALPEELKETQQRVLAKAASPQITREVKEKVEKTKTVAKKGLLGIGAGKTESVTVTETQVREEKVYIDPTVQTVYSVEADQVLGTVVPPEPGAPGVDVYGRPVPAKQLADPRFYPGEHVGRKGNELVALREGFLRIGRNWVDIVPFAPHRWEVELSADQATCYLRLTPGHQESPAPSGREILDAALALPYPEHSLMSTDELENLVAGQIAAGEAASLPISSSRDASFDIVVSEDKLQALLYIHKGKGRGKTLNLKEVGAAIKASKLKGLDLNRIGADIKNFYGSTEFDLTGYVLAEGTAASPGPDRNVEFSLRFDPDKKTEQHREHVEKAREADRPESLDSFPAAAIQKTAAVETEQLVATIDPETPGESGSDVYGNTIPAPAGAAPVFHLYEDLEQKDNIIATTAAGVLDFAEIDGEYHLRVRSHVDADIEVEVAPDRMTAYISLVDGSGTGRRISMESVHAAIEKAGISHGLVAENVEKAVEAAKAGTEVRGLAIAEGTPPVDQSENKLEMLVDLQSDGGVRLRKDGSADYRTRNEIHTVKKDQALCRILPSQQQPVEGTDVTGQAVPARTSSGLELELGDNVRREEKDDGSVVVFSQVDGEFLHAKNKLEVRTTHTIKGDVDMSVGNLKFPGTVLVGGTVRSGFYVMATGDIKIAGGVEGALLSSDGDIVIKQGVKGAGKAVLRSKQSIMSPFVELATVLSVGDILLKSAVVRSRVKCNGRVSFQGDKGRVVGGTIRARHGIEVTSVGSPRGVKTQISFGQDYLIADLIEKEEKEIEKVKTRISQVDLDMRKLEKAGGNDQLQTLRQDKVKLLKLMEKRGLRLFTLRERFEQHFPSKVIVRGDVHSGTVFESHGRVYEVTSPRKGVSVEFDPQTGNLNVNDLNGSQ